jgi:hypothetical protein
LALLPGAVFSAGRTILLSGGKKEVKIKTLKTIAAESEIDFFIK